MRFSPQLRADGQGPLAGARGRMRMVNIKFPMPTRSVFAALCGRLTWMSAIRWQAIGPFFLVRSPVRTLTQLTSGCLWGNDTPGRTGLPATYGLFDATDEQMATMHGCAAAKAVPCSLTYMEKEEDRSPKHGVEFMRHRPSSTGAGSAFPINLVPSLFAAAGRSRGQRQLHSIFSNYLEWGRRNGRRDTTRQSTFPARQGNRIHQEAPHGSFSSSFMDHERRRGLEGHLSCIFLTDLERLRPQQGGQ